MQARLNAGKQGSRPNAEPHRATRDIDLLASGDNSPAVLADILTAICAHEVETDGVESLLETLQVEERVEGRAYPSLHVEMLAALGTARPRFEIDITFGEAVVPSAQEVDLPVLLGLPAPRLLSSMAKR